MTRGTLKVRREGTEVQPQRSGTRTRREANNYKLTEAYTTHPYHAITGWSGEKQCNCCGESWKCWAQDGNPSKHRLVIVIDDNVQIRHQMNTHGTENARSPGRKIPLTGQIDCQQQYSTTIATFCHISYSSCPSPAIFRRSNWCLYFCCCPVNHGIYF
jgi:hypothetical protein